VKEAEGAKGAKSTTRLGDLAFKPKNGPAVAKKSFARVISIILEISPVSYLYTRPVGVLHEIEVQNQVLSN
jgi:hypothetical protein